MKKGNMAVIAGVVALCAALLLIVIVLLGGNVNKTGPESETAEQEQTEDSGLFKKTSKRNVRNILLIGQDKREGQERQRSDSMIICSINSSTGEITLISVMRDLYVEIPGYGSNRINAAYAYGGAELLDKTVKKNFGISVDSNLEINFESFVETLAAVGNLEIELTAEEAAYLNGEDWSQQGSDSSSWNLSAGVNSLTPEQALAYARTRNVGNSDYERTERQRKVIMAALKRLKSGGPVTLFRTALKIFPDLDADMQNRELLEYLLMILINDVDSIRSERIPVDGAFTPQSIDGMSVLVPDLEKTREWLQKTIYGGM